ncbi:divergent polysaccharide deacetylase family protein [Palleronia sp. KMU-117]|uniref:divergent polysaccharide deacetylase family protein n=1 Tax=Palleronia sp. KMU-117 TaxID=3434108 RepID=UPI003D759DB9
MARGFVSGTFWGFVVGAFIFLTATLIADRQDPVLPQPAAGAETTPAPDASEFDTVTEQAEPELPAAETAPGGSADIAEAPAVAAPAAEATPTPDETPLVAPDTAATAPAAPEPPTEAPAPLVASAPQPVEAPHPADVPAPDQPGSDAPLVAGLQAPAPPAPPAPEVPEASGAGTPAEGPEGEIAALPPTVSPEAPTAPPVAEAPREAAQPDPSVGDAAPEGGTGTSPETAPEMAPEADAAPPPESDAPPASVPGAVASAMPGQRAAPLPGIAGDPGAGAAPEAPEAPEALPAAVAAAPGAAAGMAPALAAFSTPFEITDDRPLLSVVLLVPANSEVGVETLSALPFPASYAIDAIAPDAGETARALRAAGRELLLIPSLPEGATPSDVEVALQANLAAVPEAVAFIDGPGASFQSDRTAVAQVVAAAGASGHGLVTFPRGLNTAQQIARRDGVPAALVFRDIDGEGQSGDDIRRALDQAAFRARQEGAVILVGRAEPATLAALTEWALGNRAASVALAPASAAILAQN